MNLLLKRKTIKISRFNQIKRSLIILFTTKKELEVEKEEHKDTKRDLEYAELPFWKKISTDKPGEKPV